MAASQNDYFTYVGNPGNATTLASPGHTIGGTSINVGSTSNWNTVTGQFFAIDRVTVVNGIQTQVPGSYTVWEGVVSGPTSITNMALRYGTDQNYSAGSTTRVYIVISSARENRVIDGLLNVLNQDATLKSTAIPNLSVTTAKLASLAVTGPKIDLATIPYGMITFATAGLSGGWASAITTEQPVPFDTLVSGSVEVTKPTDGQLMVARDGNYTITAQMNAVAGGGNIIHRLEYSTDAGASWKELSPYVNPVAFEAGRGLVISVRKRLLANTRVRVLNFTTSNVRFAANNSGELSICSLAVAA